MSKIKCRKWVTYEMERYPENCKECPCFSQTPYSCMNERGMEADCDLGYMYGQDMRDFSGRTRHSKCRIEQDNRVRIMNK